MFSVASVAQQGGAAVYNQRRGRVQPSHQQNQYGVEKQIQENARRHAGGGGLPQWYRCR